MNAKERALLRACATALDDWLHQYAHDQCDPVKVEATYNHIYANGGTLGYIAALQQRIREALAEKGERK